MEKSVSESNERAGQVTSVRSSGRSVEEAIQNGLLELGVSRDRVEVELLNGTSSDPEQPVSVQLTVNPDSASSFAPAAVTPAVSAAARTAEVDAPTASTATVLAETETEEQSADQANLPVPTVAKNVLEKLLNGMGIRGKVVVHNDMPADEGPVFVLDIVGADLGILIGRRGETLRDLEYLTRLIVTSKTHSNQRFAVDVEGYRARRERVLRELAKRMADRVRQNRQPITLEAMPPNERRIVHITLKESQYVKTQSIGEGDRRRVMILPK